MESFNGYFLDLLSRDFSLFCSGDLTMAIDSTDIAEDDFDSLDDDPDRELEDDFCRTFVAAVIPFWLTTTDSTAVINLSIRVSMEADDFVNSSLTD